MENLKKDWKSIFQEFYNVNKVKIYIAAAAVVVFLVYLFLTRTGYLYEKFDFLNAKEKRLEEQLKTKTDSLMLIDAQVKLLKLDLEKAEKEYDSLLKVKGKIKIVKQIEISKIKQMTDEELQRFFDERVK